MGLTKVELWGELLNSPELRVTPTGLPVAHLNLECGSEGEELRLELIMSGEAARTSTASLKPGQTIHARGSLKTITRVSKAGIKDSRICLMATEIEPVQN